MRKVLVPLLIGCAITLPFHVIISEVRLHLLEVRRAAPLTMAVPVPLNRDTIEMMCRKSSPHCPQWAAMMWSSESAWGCICVMEPTKYLISPAPSVPTEN